MQSFSIFDNRGRSEIGLCFAGKFERNVLPYGRIACVRGEDLSLGNPQWLIRLPRLLGTV